VADEKPKTDADVKKKDAENQRAAARKAVKIAGDAARNERKGKKK
jgi:hypothetical protein